MLTLSQMVTVLTALASLVPSIVSLVREGEIKKGAYDEVVSAFTTAQDARIARANAATPPSVDSDPDNRDNA